MLTILLDENIDGYADYLTRQLFSPAWQEISSALGVCFVTFEHVGLSKGTSDERIWQFCQDHQYYLLTDNRNDDRSDSLESIIRFRNSPTSLPVFTISDINRLRTEQDYVEMIVAKMLELLMEPENLRGTGRLYLP